MCSEILAQYYAYALYSGFAAYVRNLVALSHRYKSDHPSYHRLSAYLYNLTSNVVYYESLNNTAQYIKSHVLLSTSEPSFCSLCAPWNRTAPSDAGLLIEALSVANIAEISGM